MINSVYDFVTEVIVVDTGSTDNTLEIVTSYQKARVYKIGFTDFGSIRTITAHLARSPWVLMLDADETLEYPDLLRNLAQTYTESAFAFPRKRWLDIEKTQQTELEAYPDWQVRFFRNHPQYVWKRELHEYFDGAAVTKISNGPIIHHFQDVFKDEARKAERQKQYEVLAKTAKVTIQGGKPLS
jgi:glycosyltransferase involved in cell wall biosynthesis